MNTLVCRRLVRSSRVTALVAGLAVGLAAAASLGQSGGAGGGPARGNQPGSTNSGHRGEWLAATIGVDFAGGTLAEYVAAVRTNAGEWAVNVAFTDGADRLTMPAVSFRNVQLETAVRAMAQLATARGGRVRVSDAGANTQNPFPGPVGGAPMFVVGVDRPRDADTVETFSRVLSIANLTTPKGEQPAAMSPDVILSAIEAAVQNDTSNPPNIRFHKDSGLLFVSGTKQQVELAVEVLGRLENDTKARQRVSGKPITETFNLAHTPSTAVVDVLRTIFPQAPDQPARVSVVSNPQTNAAVVSAPEDQMMAVRALLRYIDSDPAKNPAVAQAQAEREAAARQAEMMAVEFHRARDQAAKSQEQLLVVRADAELAKVRAEEMARLQESTREQAEKMRATADALMQERRAREDQVSDRLRKLEAELEDARRTITSLQQQLTEAKKPK